MKICVPIVEKSNDQVIEKMEMINQSKGDLAEIWCGEVLDLDFSKIFLKKEKTLVLNCKKEDEKGNFQGSDLEKLKILQEGAKFGAEYCDFSYETEEDLLKEFISKKGGTELILSSHFWKNTPKLPALLNLVEKMKKKGADIIKIATTCQEEKDLITILRLAENLKRKKIRHITIAMGKLGFYSRFMIPDILAGEFGFAPLKKEEANAPGQLSLDDMKNLEKILNH